MKLLLERIYNCKKYCIGHLYDITNGNAILTLNAECADDNYVLSNNLSTTSLTIDYSY